MLIVVLLYTEIVVVTFCEIFQDAHLDEENCSVCGFIKMRILSRKCVATLRSISSNLNFITDLDQSSGRLKSRNGPRPIRFRKNLSCPPWLENELSSQLLVPIAEFWPVCHSTLIHTRKYTSKFASRRAKKSFLGVKTQL